MSLTAVSVYKQTIEPNYALLYKVVLRIDFFIFLWNFNSKVFIDLVKNQAV